MTAVTAPKANRIRTGSAAREQSSRQRGMIHACARFVLVWVLTAFSVTRA
jgi:hypothetical protein